LIDDAETWIDFLKKRNQIVHLYDLDLADEVYESAKPFAREARRLLQAVKAEIAKE